MKRALLFALLALAPAGSFAAEPIAITKRAITQGEKLVEFREWLYRGGNDPAWADPTLPDDDWRTVTPWLYYGDNRIADWTGEGWFRAHLVVEPVLVGEPLTLLVSQIGVCEIFLDGKRIHGSGAADPAAGEHVHYHGVKAIRPIKFDSAGEHVIAVHIADYPTKPFNYGTAHATGFEIAIGDPTRAAGGVLDVLKDEVRSRTFFATASLVMAFLGFLLWIFYPRLRSALYYAAFTVGTAAIAYLPMLFFTTSDIEKLATWMRLMNLALVWTSVTGLWFLYATFYRRPSRWIWIWPVCGVAFAAYAWNGPVDRVLLFNLLSFVEILRILIVAVLRRKPFARLVSFGVAAFILASAYQIVVETFLRKLGARDIYLYGMLVMLILIMVALARGFALTQAENELKAKELEEARKRQKVLDELEKTNEELRRTQAQLVQSEKMASLGSLVAGVAHEINTPVGAIASMHDTLVRAVGKLKTTLRNLSPDDVGQNEQVHQAFKLIEDANQVIDSGSERVTNIVRRLRSFARLDEAELKRVDLHDGLEDTLTLVHHELKRNVTVHREYGKMPPIACYPGQLNQVFLNILVNARQAMPSGGELTIRTWEEAGNANVSFADTGVGIPAERLGKIFDPGYTTKGVGVGTGLGLSICYQIVQAHRGRIDVESVVGKGTTFTVVLPTNLDEMLERKSAKTAGEKRS